MVRLQRKDLVKEFEDIVQQEINNHNNTILETNLSINELRDKIEQLKEDFSKKNASITAAVSKHSENSLEISEIIKKTVQTLNSKINDAFKSQREELEDVKKGISTRESYFLTTNDFDKFRVKVDEWISQIRCLFEQHQSILSQQISKTSEMHLFDLRELEHSWCKKLHEEMQEVSKINEELDKIAINFDGLKKEIEFTKRRCFIIEKNIENLYTQIERLKLGDK